MSHVDARTTVHGRALIVARHLQGWAQAHIAKAMGTARGCLEKWTERYDVGGLAALVDRFSHPHRCPRANQSGDGPSFDDWEQYAFLPEPDIGRTIDTPAKVLQLWTGELDAMRTTGSLCVVCCHPFLSGRPSRLRTVERFIRLAHECGDVELRSCRDVADAVIGS